MILLSIQGLTHLLYLGIEANGQVWFAESFVLNPKDQPFTYSTERVLREWNPIVRH